MITGKLSTDIKVRLLAALDAMAETRVRTDERPKLPNIIVRKNIERFCTGFPIMTE